MLTIYDIALFTIRGALRPRGRLEALGVLPPPGGIVLYHIILHNIVSSIILIRMSCILLDLIY